MYKINNKKTSELSKRVLVFGLIGVTAFGLLTSTLLSGCGRNEDNTDTSSAMTEEDYKKLSEQMEEGKYYILHNGEVSMITTAEETSPSNGTIAWFDHTIVDGTMNALAAVTNRASFAIRKLQSGSIQMYVWVYLIGALLLAAVTFVVLI